MTRKSMTALEAATLVLGKAHRPLKAGEITERVLGQRLWRTKGKPPENTIARDLHIAAKAKGAPVRKVGRGLFARRR